MCIILGGFSMLRWFCCKNCLSFDEEASVDMGANTDTAAPVFSRAAGVYGENASGKTNLLTALSAMFWNVSGSTQKGLFLQPFHKDEENDEPIILKMRFRLSDVEYEYTQEIKDERIEGELLLGGGVELFCRKGREVSSEGVPVSGVLGEVAAELENYESAVFLRLAGNKGAALEGAALYKEICDWFTRAATTDRFVSHDAVWALDQAAYIAEKDPCYKGELIGFLQWYDPCVENVEVVPYNNIRRDLRIRYKDGREELLQDESDSMHKAVMLHLYLRAPGGILEKGGVAIMDRLDAKLDPVVVRKVVGWFQDEEKTYNKGNAQIIFSVNNKAACEVYGLDKGQTYLVTKGEDGRSQLQRQP